MAQGSEPFDVVVIGSGFGGSVTANRLALAGQRVLVLERGPWRDTLPVRSAGIQARGPLPYGFNALTHLLHSFHRGRFSLPLNKAGLFEFFSSPGMDILVASTVGGGSIAYGGILQPPRNPRLWEGRHPLLKPADIERHYDKVIADMGAVRVTPEHAVPHSMSRHLPGSEMGRCRPSDPQPWMALLLTRERSDRGQVVTGPDGIQRQYCAFDGDSFLGSRGGAKASVDFIYLAPVLGKGATVRDLCKVDRLQRLKTGGYRVVYRDLATGKSANVDAPKVVLAAGCINTLRLLFVSSVGGSEALISMPMLGRCVGGNGDLMGLWSRKRLEPSSFTSAPAHGAFSVTGNEAVTFGVAGFPGVDTLPIPGFVKRRLGSALFIYGIGVDSGAGVMTFRNGHLRLDYDAAREPVFENVRAGFRALEAETGDRTYALRKPLTVHPWGGCRIGSDSNSGVVDHRGEIHGNPGLFVTDGAALPAAPGGPPSLAIAAWAHHVCDAMTQPGAGAIRTEAFNPMKTAESKRR